MAARTDFQDKYNSLLQNEKNLTSYVAGNVIDKPQPALWMIVIPVFFVFFYFQFKRYKDGLKNFKHDFLGTRKRVLDSVHLSLVNGSPLDIEDLIAAGNAPPQARAAYRDWINELIAFYRSLLEAKGSDYPSLVQSCYKKKSTYLTALNRLDNAERDLNRALLPELTRNDEETATAVEAIEKSTADFRRKQAKEVFSR